MLAKSPFQLRSLLCIHVCQGLLCWKRQEKLWPEFSLGNCQDGRTARGQQQKKFFKKNLRHKTTRSRASEGRAREAGISVLKTLPSTKVDSIKALKLLASPLQRHLLWLLPQKQRACQPFWRTVNFDALFQMKARTNFSHRITIKSRWHFWSLPMEFGKQFLVRMLLAF